MQYTKQRSGARGRIVGGPGCIRVAMDSRTVLIPSLALTLAVSSPVGAQPIEASPDESPPVAEPIAEPAAASIEDGPPEGFEPGVWPALAAVVPGVLIHGSGHYVAGDTETAAELLIAQGVGLGMILVGGGVLAASGASRRLIGVTSTLALSGVGLFFVPMLPDIYGAATGGRDAPPARLPRLTARLGYAWVYDPQFAYDHFSTVGLDARLGPVTLASSGWIALDDDNVRLRQRVDYRMLGDNLGPVADGSALDVQTAVTWHRYGSDGFSVLSGELALDGRYDLRNLSPTLDGSFVIGALGWGMELYTYDVPGLGFAEDIAEMLLLRFGWGLYFAGRRGEVSLYYDHRKDDFAAGLGVEGLGGGVPGHLGLAADFAIDEAWAIDLDLQVGSAYVAGIGLRYRYGGE